jgi:hypothetical protein
LFAFLLLHSFVLINFTAFKIPILGNEHIKTCRSDIKMEEIKDSKGQEKPPISREDAIKKIGFTALSAATMMLLLNDPAKGQQTSGDPGDPGTWP